MKELLLLLCQYPPDPAQKERMKELLSSLTDWSKTVSLINAHGIIALAANNIKTLGLENTIPHEAWSDLENGLRKSIVRNTWLRERWKEVNTILNEAGISHILLKGLALEHTLYGSEGLRQMNDNDIFINPEKALSAWTILQRNGFLPEEPKSPLFKKIEFSNMRHLPPLHKEGYILEIHNSLPGISPVDPYKNAMEIMVDSMKALTLSKEQQLIYLKEHFQHHIQSGDCQLRLYADLILLDKNTNIPIADDFILDPIQSGRTKYRRKAYRKILKEIPPEQRIKYIAGDIFPSVIWMKKRHKCSTLRALLLYPQRLGKLLWLIG